MTPDISLEYLLNKPEKYIAIVANGEFPKQTAIIQLIKDADSIIACDGAGIGLNNCSIIPDYIVGDNDSLHNQSGTAKNPYIYISDQNCNDLTKAINFTKTNFAKDTHIIIFAANGLREDHAIANIALFAQYGEDFANIFMISDYGIFTVHNENKFELHTYPDQQVSFFSFYNNQVSCKELKWPLDKFSFQFLNSGTLNQATSHKITVSTLTQLIIYRSFEIKKTT